ncbi:MAG: DUF2505 domain-containing protein [Myxococcales bacterium]|nr:DUF2505 domain-containing protein [Myxococcales bacterium]
MKLLVRHGLPCSPEKYWKMYWDDDFDAMLRKESAVERELLEERDDGDVLVRRVRITPDRELPTPVAKLLGAPKLVYEQENRWDRKNAVLHWKVLPTILPGKLDCRGTFRIQPTATGCEQVVDGEIKVNVMLVGGQIEKAVVAEIEKSYDRMAAASKEWLAAHPD